MRTVSLTLAEDEWTRARAAADRRGLTLPEMLRVLLKHEMEADAE